MKNGILIKSKNTEMSDINEINQFTRKELTEEEVYTFPIVMCDNQIDRDYDRFTDECLGQLAELFKGRTVIFDHNRTAANQCARIYSTEVKSENGLTQLIGKAYMLKAGNEEYISAIDGGILKEVSVGCRVGKQTCSICGNGYYSGECEHYRGDSYLLDDGKEMQCHVVLDDAVDAYELSFVCVPAQSGAGVTKSWYDGRKEKKPLNKKEKEGENMNYEEVKSKLSGMGIELDKLAAEKGVVPEMNVILDAVKGEFDSREEYISKNSITEICGREMSAEDVISIVKQHSELEEKAKAFEKFKADAVEKALTNGVKAKGEAFNRERWEKNFTGYSIDEINAQSEEWRSEAAKSLNAGKRYSEDDEGRKSLAINDVENYKFF